MATATTRKEDLLSPRVKREKEALLSAPPQIDTERVEILLDIYRNDGLDPTIIRRARIFHRLCAQKTIFIDGNPIVGTLTRYKYGAQLFPEEGCAWMERTNEFPLERGKVQITPEVRKWVDKGLAYWREANLFSASRKVILQKLGVDTRVLAKCGVWTEITPHANRHMIIPDFAKVVNKGLKGILAEIEAAESKLDAGEPEGLDKHYFYQAAKLVIDGMITLAHRYAALAREMATEEKDTARKRELAEIAAVCEWVPANPARNFREAVQAFWFTMLGIWQEAEASLNSPPCTFTKVLYPYYRKDKEAGRATFLPVAKVKTNQQQKLTLEGNKTNLVMNKGRLDMT